MISLQISLEKKPSLFMVVCVFLNISVQFFCRKISFNGVLNAPKLVL